MLAEPFANVESFANEPRLMSRPSDDRSPPGSATTFVAPVATGAQSPHAWIGRYRALRGRLALVAALAALVLGAIAWLARHVFSIRPGKGAPVGECVRTDAHVATWIRTLEPYVPSLHRDGSKDRFALSVLLLPLDGGPARDVPVHRGLAANEFALARILGADGGTLYAEARGVTAIGLDTFVAREHGGPLPAAVRPGANGRLRLDPADLLAAGRVAADGTWIGFHSDAELARDVAVGRTVRRVVRAEGGKPLRRCHRAQLEPDASGRYLRITSIAPLGELELVGAALLRERADAEPLQLAEPAGALVVGASDAGLAATLVVVRIDERGGVVWRADTGIDRFTLQQILPGAGSTAFVGTRPREEGRVPEPLLVLVDHATGALTTHSLWR